MAIVKAFDTSRWNHTNDEPIDFELAFQVTPPDENGYRIWSGRASVGNYYIDPWFRPDFDAARAAGFICVPYHVTTPEYPDDLQVDKFIEALDGRIPDGVVIDAELHRNQTPVRVTACNRYHAERFSQMYPGRVLFYTNASFANTYLLSNFGLPLFVANPGPGGGMNYNPAPYLPRLWNGFIAWQKDWKHAIPGVPDTTTDYSEFQMSEAEARAYFGMDEQEDDEMSEILEKLDLVLENLGIIIAMLDGAEPPVEPPVVPPVVPPPAASYWVRVTVPKANARFAKSHNANGLPIMQIYPSDSSPVSERIQFTEGTMLTVIREKVRADGGGQYYELTARRGRNDETLFNRDDDCIKTW